jgi:hypothetical protein
VLSVRHERLEGGGGGVVIVECGRRSWDRVEPIVARLGLPDAPVYAINYYRGGPVPRPAYELLFFTHGFDMLGYTRPTLRQIAALAARGWRGGRRAGLDPEEPIYRPGGVPFEEAAARLLESLVERVEAGETLTISTGGVARGNGEGDGEGTPPRIPVAPSARG